MKPLAWPSLARGALYAGMVALSFLFVATGLGAERELREAICAPVGVGVLPGRISIQCANASFDGTEIVQVFVAPVTDALFADLVLQTANTALTRRRLLAIQYQAKSWSTAPPPPGCESADCRLIVAVSIH